MKVMKQVRVEELLWQEAKAAAAKSGLSLQDWIDRAIRGELQIAKITIVDGNKRK